MRNLSCIVFFFCFASLSRSQEADTNITDSLAFRGQLSAWAHFNPSNDLLINLGGRYIPEISYGIQFPGNHLIDLEITANVFGNTGFNFQDSADFNGKIKPYRAWIRYSSEQFELRAGLQKINFGSASMLRPLMWFDQIDARDPLQLTDGVWGLLGRYYFLNNANLWLWVLYGNKNPKGWEQIKTNVRYPEFGGRLQLPFPKGEAGLSYHHRDADSRDMDSLFAAIDRIPENRIGLDVRFDLVVGCWLEGSWIGKRKDLGILTHQHLLNLGLDYTFGIGNGIYTAFEQLIVSADEKAFAFEDPFTFSLLTLNYPISIFDNLSAIVYFSWENHSLYNFIYWQRQFNRFAFYIMAYWNPEDYRIPAQAEAENLYAGKGVQVMMVFNH